MAASSNTRLAQLTGAIVTTHYRYKRPPLRRAKSAAAKILAIVRAGTKPKAATWGLVAAGTLLAGCAAGTATTSWVGSALPDKRWHTR